MKKLILIFILIPNLLLSADKYQTNVPNVYIKNFQCSGSYVTFNLVNKSSQTIRNVDLVIFDSDGDPIDEKSPSFVYVEANSGKRISIVAPGCSNFNRVGFRVR